MQSLFVVSLPRSFSTNLLRFAQQSLGLRAPIWVTDGEVLNVDRYAHFGGVRFDEGAKFTTRGQNPVLHAQMLNLLEQVIAGEGHAYKDVVQPFVMSAWLGNAPVRVIRIKRDLTEVVHAMLLQGWFYPRFAAQQHPRGDRSAHAWRRLFQASPRHYRTLLLPLLYRSRLTDAMVEGLARADRVLDAIPATQLHFEDLITGEDRARAALQCLYPDATLRPASYVDDTFRKIRERVARRRESVAYRRLAIRVQQVLQNLRS